MKNSRTIVAHYADQPLVSVVMNCFNGEKYIDAAVQSILSQTYPNWELIFWDNQSTDQSADIFSKYNDSRFKYFLSDRHTPLYQARRLAVDNSSGEFVTFLDVDDYWFPDKLVLQVEAAISTRSALVYSDYFFENRKNQKRKLIKSNRLTDGDAFQQLSKKYSIALSTLMVRRDVYYQVGGFDSRFNIIGDYDLVLRISAKYLLYCIQRPLVSYRWHGENLSVKQSGVEIEEIGLWLAKYSREDWVGSCGIKNISSEYTYGLVKLQCKKGQRYSAALLIWKIRKARLFLRAVFWLFLPSWLSTRLQA